ncbi:MAG: biotin--[acetyl-CoA-carboxylase] ligase [Alphaproteobacteria bacterium]|nr:biotin--[acetyl-CoA-carboxylase] ligase [Alphaproteobacteria bacterium]
MDEARAAAGADAPDGLVVWAREQTGGRGRLGRQWHSPPGNLYMTVLLRENCPPAVAAQLGFVMALAVAEYVAPVLRAAGAPEADLRLKWPNDVLLGGRKLAGILLESALRPQGGLAWLLCGIGVNVAHHPDVPDRPSTALAAAIGGPPPDPGEALSGVVSAVADWRKRWRREGFAPVRAAWLARAHPVGTPLEARLPGGATRGTFAGIDADGTLLLAGPGGLMHRIAAGEVHALPGGTLDKA